MQQVKGNKRFIDGCFSCIHDGLADILLRVGNQIDFRFLVKELQVAYHFSFSPFPVITMLDSWRELPVDRLKILQHMALFIFATHVSGTTGLPLVICCNVSEWFSHNLSWIICHTEQKSVCMINK